MFSECKRIERRHDDGFLKMFFHFIHSRINTIRSIVHVLPFWSGSDGYTGIVCFKWDRITAEATSERVRTDSLRFSIFFSFGSNSENSPTGWCLHFSTLAK